MSQRKTAYTWVGVALAVLPSMGIPTASCTAAGAENAATAKLHQAMAQENYLEAKREADKMLQSRNPEERLAASLAYGRILLSQGRKAEARTYLATMKRLKLDASAGSLMRVYELWLAALEGDGADAVKSLQEIVDSKGHRLATAEAADVLAQLYLQRGEQEKAKQAVDAGLAFLAYVGTKGSYIETILRNRLNGQDPARRLFETAEQLRQQKKFVEAGQKYAQVRTGFPKSEWSDPAGYRMGECLVGLERYPQAFDYWQAFVKELPAGPWRGQAHVAMIDLCLERQFNLAAAEEHVTLAASILDNMKDKTAEKSWQDAAFDIRLRQVVVSLVQRRFDEAAAALKQVKPLVPQTPEVQAWVAGLIQTAENKSPVTPTEFGEVMDQSSVVATVGNLYGLLGQNARALACCEPILTSSARGAARTHRSFAALGVARARKGMGERDKAIAAYRESLSQQNVASWHEDTLRELALLMEQPVPEKAKATAKAEKTAANKKSACGCNTERNPTAKERARQRAEALPYWTDLTVNYPASRYVPEALYHIGLLQGGIEQWQKALVSFDRLAREYPDCPWAGEAHLQLIDILLERQFDLAGAEGHAAAAIAWFEQRIPKKAAAAANPADASTTSAVRPLSLAGYDIYVRAGLLEYLQEHYQQAKAMFEKARPFSPPREFTVAQGQIPTGIERLIEVAQSGKPITPEVVRQGDPTAKLILMLADIYLQGQEYRQSWCLCDRLLDGAAPKATREQRGWALLERGRSAFQLSSQDPQFASLICKGRTSDSIKAALADFQSAALTAPKTEWAPTALFLAANIQWNQYQDLRTAVTLWQRLAQRYPQSDEAARSAYYVAVVYQWGNRPQDARRAFEEFLQKQPDSHLAGAAREHIKELELAAATPAGNVAAPAGVPHKAVRGRPKQPENLPEQ